MPFIRTGKNLNEVPEEAAVPEGEYDLRVVNVESTRTKANDRDMVALAIRVEDSAFPAAKLVRHYAVLPNENDFEEDDGRMAALFLRGLKRLLAVFEVEFGEEGFETEDLDGATGRCFLNVREYNGEDQNELRLPRLRE